ncbi:hypothetical protein FA15DRAFT_709739 [Coprinopsis marcescibilis]|uniref:Uncharacterized protein n=1 Tax=Coprinopsis marcescibilis TaxID=230819 RepID=A0A5C3KFW7_COPMA|nr:hypothetical protein FA15DRAFT_709739 [Coprinopsis marcescibilis]
MFYPLTAHIFPQLNPTISNLRDLPTDPLLPSAQTNPTVSNLLWVNLRGLPTNHLHLPSAQTNPIISNLFGPTSEVFPMPICHCKSYSCNGRAIARGLLCKHLDTNKDKLISQAKQAAEAFEAVKEQFYMKISKVPSSDPDPFDLSLLNNALGDMAHEPPPDPFDLSALQSVLSDTPKSKPTSRQSQASTSKSSWVQGSLDLLGQLDVDAESLISSIDEAIATLPSCSKPKTFPFNSLVKRGK